jgi:secondary thiamine-phosphate synthase enzyme
MSRSSIATVRANPVVDRTAASGDVRVHGETFTVETTTRVEVIDLTERVMRLVHTCGVREGHVSLVSLHTTACIFINEFQAALAADFKRFLEQIAAGSDGWLHDDPRHSDCARTNADAHLRALMLSHGAALQVSGGELVLGRWQRVLLAELDGPQRRTLRVSVMGIA